MFKNWGQALSIALTFYISLAKGLQLKVKSKKISRAIIRKITWEELIGETFSPFILKMINDFSLL